MAIVNISTTSDQDYVHGFVLMAGDTPIDLTGQSMRMGVRRHAEDSEEQLLLTTENGGITIVDPPGGKFVLTIRQATLLMLYFGDYEHSLIRIIHYAEGDIRYRVWSGTLSHAAGPSR